LDEADAGVEELRGPGGDGAEVEGADLAGAAAEQLEAEGGADGALPARHSEPHALDPLVRAQMHPPGSGSLSLSLSAGAPAEKTEPGSTSTGRRHRQPTSDDDLLPVVQSSDSVRPTVRQV